MIVSRRVIIAWFELLAASALACNAPISKSESPEEPVAECVAYAKKLHTCLEAVGDVDAPSRGALALQAASAARDETQRESARQSCVRELARLTSSCR